MKTKVAKVVAVGLIVTELAVADYALLKMLRNGFEVELTEEQAKAIEAEVGDAAEAAFEDIESSE